MRHYSVIPISDLLPPITSDVDDVQYFSLFFCHHNLSRELQPSFIYQIEFSVCELGWVIIVMETYQQQGDVTEHRSALKS